MLSPTIYTVNSTGNGTSGSGTSGPLTYVISQANANTNTDGSEIEFDSSVFSTPQTIAIYGTLVLTETAGPEVIEGPAAGIVTIENVTDSIRSSVFDIDQGTTATLVDCTITGNGQAYSDGVANAGTATLTGCSISKSWYGVSNSGTATLNGCEVGANVGGLSNSGTATITGGSIGGSGFDEYNRGFYYPDVGNSGTVTLTNCSIGGSDDPASVFNRGTATLTNCSVSGNAGEGVFNSGTATLSGCTIRYNDAGGLYNYNKATLTDCSISGNFSRFGGHYASRYDSLNGMLNSGIATLTGCTISGNYSQYDGGGLSNRGTATLTDCTISGNTALSTNGVAGAHRSGCGGGLANYGTASLTGCTISGNTALSTAGVTGTDGGGGGGGLANYGTAALAGCTISGNSAYLGGDGVSNYGTATLTACTISGNGNGFVNPAYGPGEGVRNDSILMLTGCTISGNNNFVFYSRYGLFDAGYGQSGAATATLIDTIVSGNNMFPQEGVYGDFSGSDDLIATVNLAGFQNGENGIIVGVDPDLGRLGDYGGPTETMPLLGGSPAIGAGTAVSGITTDQRGFPLDSPNPDIGAFQVQPSLVVNTTIDGTGSPVGDLSLRQAVNLANAQASGPASSTSVSSITFASSIAGGTISLLSPLPALGSYVAIIGPITLNGSSAGGDGLEVDGSYDSIQDLTITSFDGAGVEFSGQGDNSVTGSTIIDNGAGIDIFDSATGDSIGGTTAGAGNVIADNNGNGVTVGYDAEDPAVDNAILGNSIYGNSGLGIDLGDDGVTLNNASGHTGPNLFQNFPVLASATDTSEATVIAGSLSASPNTTYRIEFFSNPAADPTGYGQGETYLTFADETTNSSGTVSFSVQTPNLVPAGQFISATATDPAGNTSEFSADIAVSSTSSAVDTTTSLQSSEDPSQLGDSVTFTATVSAAESTNGTPTGSVQFSIDGAAAGNPVPLDADGDATLTTSSLAVGSHTVAASYINTDGNFNDSDATLAGGQVVTTADTTVAVGSSAPTSVYGQSVTFTITVSAVTAGLPTPTGMVDFYDGSSELISASLSGGIATYSTSELAVGTHTITVQYLGDSNFSGSTSPSTTQIGQPGKHHRVAERESLILGLRSVGELHGDDRSVRPGRGDADGHGHVHGWLDHARHGHRE